MISINPRDPRPIYLQIKEGLCRLILSGAVKTGERLPSVRELAGQLAINPNTIQRAYEALEREGYLYTVAGKGSFAAPQADVNADRRARLLEQFDASAAELLFLGLTAGELAARLQAAETGRTGHREEERA